jgi:glycosyltransferase involved in cell wall biosynthesis
VREVRHEARRDGTVLIAAPGWHDDRPGGANKLPTDFARFLAARGHDVTYLCPSDVVDRVAIDRIDGVSVRRYPAPTSPSPSVRNVRRHWRLSKAIASDVSRERPVRALLGHTQIQYLAASGALDAGVRRCYGVHSPFEAELREGAIGTPTMKQRFAWRGAAWMERRLLEVSDIVHYDSRYTEGSMEAQYPHATRGKGIVLPGWVDDARFRPASVTRDELRRRLGAPWTPGVTTFFTLRRLVPRMGLASLVGAVALLAARGRAFRLVIGGDGPERPALEAQVSAAGLRDRVSFLGRIPEGDLVDSFAAADCFVLPTRALECFGLIVLESYACGVPVVAVPVGSIPEVIGPDFAAWIAADNSAPAIADRMDDVLSGRLTADPCALRAWAATFSLNVVAERHERVLLGGPPEEAARAVC